MDYLFKLHLQWEDPLTTAVSKKSLARCQTEDTD